MGDIAAFIASASERNRGQIRGVGLKKDAFERYALYGFGYRSLFICKHASDADVPVSEFLELAECLDTAAEGMEDSFQ